ncbi:hypothetical protein MAMC_00115 [Methylacidimicrobium cyclopophantes]|uniref:Uncharacterized protein n=1 Tax=Methylacidimicrobium cyclopophantes TaxID=1041766 RepID=A0A5E6M826_9BACT|nr:hypothetical protein [Methylacidimicrobium cyclopophantes]VVM04551.1 hypothetical protein MAMC_00115 [Methylacidimicrobium cyclopophantes]
MKILLAALGLFFLAPVAFGSGFSPDRSVQGEGRGISLGQHSMGSSGISPRLVPVQAVEGLPEGMPWEDKSAGDGEGATPSTEEGGEPSAPQEEVP